MWVRLRLQLLGLQHALQPHHWEPGMTAFFKPAQRWRELRSMAERLEPATNGKAAFRRRDA